MTVVKPARSAILSAEIATKRALDAMAEHHRQPKLRSERTTAAEEHLHNALNELLSAYSRLIARV